MPLDRTSRSPFRFPFGLTLTLLLVLQTTTRAWAWGRLGHRVTARLAELHLTPKAKAEIKALLADGESLADCSTWADERRREMRKSAPWHYVDVPLDEPRYDPRFSGDDSKKGFIVPKIAEFRATLRDSSKPVEKRREALRFIVHLVGDLHMPMHVGDNHNRGGNDTQIRFFDMGSNMHRLWDSDLIEPRLPSIYEILVSSKQPRSAACVLALLAGIVSSILGLVRNDLIRPHLEAFQRRGPEAGCERDIRRVSAPGDQDAPDSGRIVASIEGVPSVAEIGLEPGRKVHGRIGWRPADIAEITSAVTRRDIHTTAERDGEMGKVATHALAILKNLKSGLRWARKAVAELDVLMDEIADGLDALPASRRGPEQAPRSLGQQVGLAIAATEQEEQGLVGERLHGPLLEPRRYQVGVAGVGYDSIAAQPELPRRCHDAAAPVAETVPIGRDRNGRSQHQVIGLDQVRDAAVVNTQRDDHRCRLRAPKDQLVADLNLHG